MNQAPVLISSFLASHSCTAYPLLSIDPKPEVSDTTKVEWRTIAGNTIIKILSPPVNILPQGLRNKVLIHSNSVALGSLNKDHTD